MLPSEYREHPYSQDPAVRVARCQDNGQIAPDHAVHARHRRSGLRDRGAGQTLGGTAQFGGVRARPRRRPRCRSTRSGLSMRACHVQGLLNIHVVIASLAARPSWSTQSSSILKVLRSRLHTRDKESVNATRMLLGHPVIVKCKSPQ